MKKMTDPHEKSRAKTEEKGRTMKICKGELHVTFGHFYFVT